MPTTWTLSLPAEPGLDRLGTPDRLHAVGCGLFESTHADHSGGGKPFAVRPLVRREEPGPADLLDMRGRRAARSTAHQRWAAP